MDITGFEKIAKYLAVPLVLVGFALMLVFGIHDKLIASGLLTQVSAKDTSEIIKLLLRYGFQLGMSVTVLGFALAAWSKHIDSEVQPVDAAKLARELLGPQLAAKDEQIKALTEAITALSKTGAPAASINDALQALEQGDTAKAQAIFAEVLRSKEAEGRKANKEAAAAARHLGALAYMNNPKEALLAYQKAVELDPDNADGWNPLGLLLKRTGELTQAEEAFRKVLALAEARQDKEKQAWALGNLGNVYRTRGELDKAEEMYRKVLALHQSLGSKEGMAADYANLGIVAYTRGELDKAEEMHRKALELHQALGHKEYMAANYGNLGIVYKTRGELDKAEEMYRKALAINEALGSKEVGAGLYGNLGEVYRVRGELDKAEEMHRKALELFQDLGGKEGIALSYGNLGFVYAQRGNLAQAEAALRKSLSLYQEMGAMQHPDAKKVQQWLDELAQQRASQTVPGAASPR
ncbi:tetratricopeptide repeat protein [Candidatus Electronema sp. JC]|uniref:tetratricopeptide repeat protein n=1 Tax=Candidatus Electronema sp. JC TaxID=3401570 RepID=UPI003AA98C4F